MTPDFSSIISKDNAKVGIPTTMVILLAAMIMSNGGEYFPSNPIDDVKDNDKDLDKILQNQDKILQNQKEESHQDSVIKKKLNKIINAICPNPDFPCIDR